MVQYTYDIDFWGRRDFRHAREVGWGYYRMTLSALALILEGSISKRPESAGCFLFLPPSTDRQELSMNDEMMD